MTKNQSLAERYLQECPSLDRLEKLCIKRFAEWLDERPSDEPSGDRDAFYMRQGREALPKLEAALGIQAGEKLRCTCVWFTREGSTVTQHFKGDRDCPAHGEQIRSQEFTLTGLPERTEA